MRPEQTRERLKSAGIARARMFLKANIDWLDGGPVAQRSGCIVWRLRPRIGLPSGESVVVDRDLLRRAQSAVSTLGRHFPQAMSKIVDDVDAWRLGALTTLERLKHAIHADEPILGDGEFPTHLLSRNIIRTIEQVLERHPSMMQLIQFCAWSGCTCRSTREFLIPWIVGNADWIDLHLRDVNTDAPITNVLLVGDLACIDGEVRLKFLTDGLGALGSFQASTAGLNGAIGSFVQGLRNWRDPKSDPPRPEQPSGPAYAKYIADFLHWLAGQEQGVRSRATLLCKEVLSSELVVRSQRAWEKFRSAAHKTRRSLCDLAKKLSKADFHSEACRMSYEFENEVVNDCVSYPMNEILNSIRQIASNRTTLFTNSLCDLLSLIPTELPDGQQYRDGWSLRLSLLCEAPDIRSEQTGISYYQHVKKYVHVNRNNPRQLRPWERMISCWNGACRGDCSPLRMLREDLPRSKWGDFFEMLGWACSHPKYDYELNSTLATLLKGSQDVNQACDRFRKAAPTGLLLDAITAQLDAAAALECEGFAFDETLRLVGPGSKIDTWQIAPLLNLHSKFAKSGWKHLIPTLLNMSRASEICRIATQFEIASSYGVDVIFRSRAAGASLPEWARHYPTSLHASIAAFVATFPESHERIAKILEQCFPNPIKIQSEIRVLQRLENETPDSPPWERANRQRRLENLTRRLNEPAIVSPAALDRLQRKLDEALLIDALNDASAGIGRVLIELIGGRIGLREFAEKMLPPRHLDLLRGILELHEPYRTFGLRLLRKQWGNIPWDLEQEPANQRFLESQKARGILVDHWLDSRTTSVVIEGQTRPWTLAFESNCVEVMLMGHYFGTCLSPNDCNFYSAIVNGIDINKRVLFARDYRGEVVGRCLFAIGDAGTVMAFRAYSHEGQTDFEKCVAKFASDLAADMKTVVSHTDDVSNLVAPDWYDDGAHDLGNSIAGDQSRVRTALQNATEQTIVASLESALSPAGLSDPMLELIVELPEFTARPELIVPLLPRILASESQLGVTTLMTTARLAHRAGVKSTASRILARYAPDWLRRELLQRGGYQTGAYVTMHIMIESHPSQVLRVLRATRSRNTRRDEDETEDERRKLLAACFESLGRPRLAAAMKARQ